VTSDPVSWMVVERGWKVVDEHGEEVGHVDDVRGDAERDIFDGIDISHGVLSEREYVPSEQVAEIREGCVVVRR
jgi:uncharacterized protein YrrD